MGDQRAAEAIGSDRPASHRELWDVLAVGVLAAVTLRILASLAAGAVRIGTHAPGLVFRGAPRVGEIVGWFAEFGDGFGVVLASVSLGLVWWQVYSVPHDPSPEAVAHSRRSMRLCSWMTAVFAMTAAASLAYAISDWMLYWDDPERWLRVAASGFYISYCVIGLLGLYATRQLFWRAVLLSPDDRVLDPD